MSLVCLLLMSLLMSCFNNRLPKEEVERMTIIAFPVGEASSMAVITEKLLVNEIVQIISSSHREPAKFRAEYKIEIKYKNNTKYILVNETYLTIDGLTYVANENLGARLATFFVREKH